MHLQKSFSFIKELESLEVLWLYGLHLKEFPDIIPSHSKSSLQQLHFCFSDIEYLPSSIGNLHKLVDLDLENCGKLKGLSERICSLQHLKVLNLGDCGIKELPDYIGQLEHLERLVLSDTKVKHLPDSICKLKHLKKLNLSFCEELEKLPEKLGDLECLEELDLNNCYKIREIPSSICKLRHLKDLDLSFCKELKKLPENLGDLKCLELLHLRYTPISHLPYSISLLKGLKILGYEKRTDPDALLSQEQQHTTRAPKRRRTDIEATTSGDVMNESQPFDLNVQPVDQASPTSYTSVNES